MYNSSRGNSYHVENECSDDSIFLDYRNNVSAILSFSCHPDNNHIQEEKVCEAIFLSPNEISDLLAHDLEKYVSASKDAHISLMLFLHLVKSLP